MADRVSMKICICFNDSATHHSFNRILFSCFSFTRYSNSFFIRLLTSRIVRPDILCSFAFSSNSLMEISFLSSSNSLISFLPFSSFVSVAFPSFPSSITRFKITGGEPLVRKDCVQLISEIKSLNGVEQVTLTTNGVLLEKQAGALKRAGVDCINVSLDTLDPRLYRQITGQDALEKVVAGILQAEKLDIPVHANTVLPKSINDAVWQQVLSLAEKGYADVRFIELMPIGEGKSHKGIANKDILDALCKLYPELQPVQKRKGNGPAVYYEIPGFRKNVGFISPVHGKFCAACNRIRMTADGHFKPCLCYGESIDGREILRAGNHEQIRELLQRVILAKPQMHCFDTREKITENKQMVQIGG